MKFNNLFTYISVLGLGAVVAACGGGDSPGDGYHPSTAAERFVNRLNVQDIFETYRVAKDPTRVRDVIVVEVGVGEYRAVDLRDPDRSDYLNDLAFFDNESFRVWYDGSGYYQDIWGTLYEQSTQTTKDLESLGAALQQERIRSVGEQLAANYGLSEERSLEVASFYVEYKNLAKSRQLTDADANAFSEKVLGFNVNEAVEAYKDSLKGDTASVDSLIEQAAQVNETSPEHIKELMNEFIK